MIMNIPGLCIDHDVIKSESGFKFQVQILEYSFAKNGYVWGDRVVNPKTFETKMGAARACRHFIFNIIMGHDEQVKQFKMFKVGPHIDYKTGKPFDLNKLAF